MPSILILDCRQEVATFNPWPSCYEDFDVIPGHELIGRHRNTRSSVAGAIDVFEKYAGVRMVPAFGASACSGGILDAPGFKRLSGELLQAVREALPVDGVYFSMHGSMVAEGEEDPEGWLLEQVRNILGERIPIVISLDLHGVVTERMLQQSDAAVLYHTYPHVDLVETGKRAAALLLKILNGHARPVTALVEIPALVRGDELLTETGLYGKMLQDAQAFERSPGGLAAGLFIGNPFTDVPGLQSGSLFVSDRDPNRAAREALKLAEFFWAVREKLHQPLLPLEDAVRAACDAQGPLLLMDAADAPSSGASGDGNSILREVMRQKVRQSFLIPIIDASAVQAAMAAGVGQKVRVNVGGTRDPIRFQPLELEARVRLISDGRFAFEVEQGHADAGPTAVLESGPVTLVAFSRPISLHDRALFLAHGLDPARFHATVVKCPHWHPRYFEDWAKGRINADAPGATSANLRYLGHTRCKRPIFPLDAGVKFEHRVKLFSRNGALE
ncbi:MAG: hypothetical protein AMXMBFR7_52290 [Planctomycetota bacterium]